MGEVAPVTPVAASSVVPGTGTGTGTNGFSMARFAPALTLAERELVRFFRQRGRVIGALLTPILFWLFLGSGFGSMSAGGTDYMTYAFPGTIVMIILFTSIFSAISLIEDRKEGFLQGVLVAPVARSQIVLGKVLGGATIALVQAALFLLLAPTLEQYRHALSIPSALGMLCVIAATSFGLSATGFFFAWRTDSIQSFHSVMNLVLFPMWLLSGAIFPPETANAWLRVIMYANPLTYSVTLLQALLRGDASRYGWPLLGASIAIVLAFAAGAFYAATWLASRERVEVQP